MNHTSGGSNFFAKTLLPHRPKSEFNSLAEGCENNLNRAMELAAFYQDGQDPNTPPFYCHIIKHVQPLAPSYPDDV